MRHRVGLARAPTDTRIIAAREPGRYLGRMAAVVAAFPVGQALQEGDVMIDRRQFMVTALAGSTMLSRSAFGVGAQPRYDVIVKGGRVIDPSLRLDAVRDVAISGGRIAAVEPEIAADAAAIIDARGKIVVPGLIDIHTHAARIKDGPSLCLADGVTGFIDAGSQGADGIDQAVAFTRSAPPGTPSPGTATPSSASRRGCHATSQARTTTRCCGARARSSRHWGCP